MPTNMHVCGWLPAGWSGAKAHAATQLLSNPNTYFYRHVAPNEEQVGSCLSPIVHAAICVLLGLESMQHCGPAN
jgi:hypothetical protein